LSGPDRGFTKVFRAPRVSIGDDPQNDLKLNDPLVSRFHGALEIIQNQFFIYRDLGSRNGSVVVSGETRHHLHDRQQHQSIQINTRARVALGQTVLDIEVQESMAVEPVNIGSSPRLPRARTEVIPAVTLAVPTPAPSPDKEDSPQMSGIARRTIERAEAFSPRLTKHSDQLQVVFRLARELNSLNQIDDILERLVRATFDMFPLANFFAISVQSTDPDGSMTPIFIRTRSGQSTEPMLSQSLLNDVVRGREAVMYVRDVTGDNDTRNSILMARITACLAAPLLGQHKLMGVVQVDSRGQSGMFTPEDLDLFTLIASSGAFALERAELTRDIYQMFEAFVYASVAAIDARDPTTAGHSQRVADYTLLLAQAVNGVERGPLSQVRFRPDELTELRYAALLHDFGKIGVREAVLQKSSRLTPERFSLIQQRLDTLRALSQRELLASHYHDLLRAGRAPTAADAAKLDAAVAAESRRLDRFSKALRDLQVPRPLTSADIAIVQEMARLTLPTPGGPPTRLLEDEDLLNLSIHAGTLNDAERRHIESHAGLSRDYLSKIPWRSELARIPCIAGDHHEKLDGSGYPRGIPAPEIIPQVRILTICDIFDALTAKDRPYKRARSVPDSCNILREEADQLKLDPSLVGLFIEAVVPQLEDGLREST
jgi:HD-GYP domain-containing protein (c-di-GMP phosphodiesterase class II)